MTDLVTEAPKARPLSEEEKRTLQELMTRENAWAGPAVRVGEPYEALINLSVPRRGDVNRQCDLVRAGEIVYLTQEEAAKFNRRGRDDGRQVDVVRKLTGPDGSREALPRILPRMVSGRLFRPTAPPPGSDAPRPDPEGSSRLEFFDTPVPEADQPQPDPAHSADVLTAELQPDAVDLPPRRTRTRGGQSA